jgi:hypothetical protein
MLNNIFFTIVFIILDYFFIWLIFTGISLIAMKYAYKKWHYELLSSDVRFMFLIVLILLSIILILSLIAIIYVISLFIINFHGIMKYFA